VRNDAARPAPEPGLQGPIPYVCVTALAALLAGAWDRSSSWLTQTQASHLDLLTPARWGLVELDVRMAPYDLRAGEEGAVTSELQAGRWSRR
jgi:hypothetical protein